MTTTQDNKEIVRREFEVIWNERNLDEVDQLLAEELKVATERAGSEDELVDRSDLKNLAREWLTAFPDATMEINEMVSEGDRVMVRWTLHGTHDGAFRGIDATGTEVAVGGFGSRRVRDGEIVETKSSADLISLLEQLDAEVPLET